MAGRRPSDSPTRSLARRTHRTSEGAARLVRVARFAMLARCCRWQGVAPRTPRHALSLAAPAALLRARLGSVAWLASLRSPAAADGGARPSDSPTRALARAPTALLRA